MVSALLYRAVRDPPAAAPEAAQAKADEKTLPVAAMAAPPPTLAEPAPEVARSKADMADAAAGLRPENKKRLQMLDRLRARNLITEEAYREKRQAILQV